VVTMDSVGVWRDPMPRLPRREPMEFPTRHLPDLGHLLRGEFVRREARTGHSVVEVAGRRGASPGTQPRGRESDDPQYPAESEHTSRTVDGAEESFLVAAVWDAQAGEVGLQQAEDSEEDAKDGLEASDAPLELGDANLKISGRGVQARRGGHLKGSAPQPAGHRGAWDADAGGDRRVPCFLDEPDEAVVVGSLLGLGGHSPMVRRGGTEGKRERGRRYHGCREVEQNMQKVVTRSSAACPTGPSPCPDDPQGATMRPEAARGGRGRWSRWSRWRCRAVGCIDALDPDRSKSPYLPVDRWAMRG